MIIPRNYYWACGGHAQLHVIGLCLQQFTHSCFYFTFIFVVYPLDSTVLVGVHVPRTGPISHTVEYQLC